jgi:hypothetical protein
MMNSPGACALAMLCAFCLPEQGMNRGQFQRWRGRVWKIALVGQVGQVELAKYRRKRNRELRVAKRSSVLIFRKTLLMQGNISKYHDM